MAAYGSPTRATASTATTKAMRSTSETLRPTGCLTTRSMRPSAAIHRRRERDFCSAPTAWRSRRRIAAFSTHRLYRRHAPAHGPTCAALRVDANGSLSAARSSRLPVRSAFYDGPCAWTCTATSGSAHARLNIATHRTAAARQVLIPESVSNPCFGRREAQPHVHLSPHPVSV